MKNEPAFPTENARQTGSNSFHYEGMTLRDYFAAKAMQEIIKVTKDNKIVASYAYELADAMLEERERKEST